jgi:hypothetical protein
VLLAAKFPEDLSEAAGRPDAGPALELRPGKAQQEDFTGTQPICYLTAAWKPEMALTIKPE